MRRCGLHGCNSDEHSRYLHEDGHQPHNETNQPKPGQHPGNNQRDETSNQNQTTAETRTHTTRQADYVSLMVLPAVISNGTKTLKVNVMLDNCSTGSYVSDAAAEDATREKPTTYNFRNRRYRG